MPLSHLRVVEIGCLPAGAFCARLFADFGADVLKFEPPGGDLGRFAPPLVEVSAGARESVYFGFLNANKRSATLPAGSDAFDRLLAAADVVIDASGPSEPAIVNIDHEKLRRANPAIVILKLSWFGESGPYRDFNATDAVCRALAGTVELVGPTEGPPRPIPDYQAAPVAGLTAFIAGMAALQKAQQTGGRRLEISALEASLAIADYNAALAWGIGAKDRRWGVNKFAPNFPLGIYRCKAGWIGVTVVTPAQWKTFCQLLGLDDLIGDARYLINRDRLRSATQLEARFADRFLTRTADEWFAIGLEQRMPFVVVPTMADLLASAEFRRRRVFVELTHGNRRYETPGSPLRLASTPPQAGGAVPAAGAAALTWTTDDPRPAPPVRSPAHPPPADQPLAGLRVIDLSMGWAGPLATRHLADLGCDIVKVEACQYPDWWRGVDTRPIVIEQMLYEKSSYFNVLNRNKRGITLDLTTTDGVRLVKELVKTADAVIENYSAGVLPKLGLDYDSLRRVKPDLIMLSMPAFAADGPWRECRAYGSTLEQASGLPSVTGAPDGPPAMNHIAYGDPIGGLHAASALLVALHHRRRTGEGNRIDMSQVECMLTMVAPWIAEQSANGKVAPRLGARHPGHVPHNCFPSRDDDSWIFITAADGAQWLALAETIGRRDLAADADLATLAGRRQREDEIEAAVAAWSRGRSADEAMHHLQRHGVAAGAVRSPLDLLDDPHLKARRFWQWIDRAHVGRHPQPSPPYRESEHPYAIAHPAPTLGQHNHDVLRGILGLSDEEIARLTDIGVIGTRAVPPNLRKARAAAG